MLALKYRFITKFSVKAFCTNQKYVLHKYLSNYITFFMQLYMQKPFFKYHVKIGQNYF